MISTLICLKIKVFKYLNNVLKKYVKTHYVTKNFVIICCMNCIVWQEKL